MDIIIIEQPINKMEGISSVNFNQKDFEIKHSVKLGNLISVNKESENLILIYEFKVISQGVKEKRKTIIERL